MFLGKLNLACPRLMWECLLEKIVLKLFVAMNVQVFSWLIASTHMTKIIIYFKES